MRVVESWYLEELLSIQMARSLVEITICFVSLCLLARWNVLRSDFQMFREEQETLRAGSTRQGKWYTCTLTHKRKSRITHLTWCDIQNFLSTQARCRNKFPALSSQFSLITSSHPHNRHLLDPAKYLTMGRSPSKPLHKLLFSQRSCFTSKRCLPISNF